MVYIYNNIEDRLKNYINKTDTCWLWIGHKNEHGYGLVTIGRGKQVRAHRYMYEKYNGKIKDNLLVCHKCDTRNCVNPDHLFLGTQKENMSDASIKGRIGYKSFHGESHHMSKLTMAKAEEIRNLWAKGGLYQREIGERFGVSQAVVSKIIKGELWTKNGTTLVKKVNI